jgi:hypothetical protein
LPTGWTASKFPPPNRQGKQADSLRPGKLELQRGFLSTGLCGPACG